MAVADPNAVGNAPGGKLNILREGEKVPATAAVQKLSGETKAGTVYDAGIAQNHAGTV